MNQKWICGYCAHENRVGAMRCYSCKRVAANDPEPMTVQEKLVELETRIIKLESAEVKE